MHAQPLDADARPAATSASRRSVLRRALAAAGLLVGGAGDAAAGTDDEPTARIYLRDLSPGARFDVVSGPLDYEPRIDVQAGESFLVDLYWAGYETRVVRYANTRERVLCFPEQGVVAEGQRYRFDDDYADTRLTTDLVEVGVERVDGE